MSIDGIVINASPLIALFRSGQAGVLPQLFSRIIVPDAVWLEVANERDDAAGRGVASEPWLVRENVTASPRILAWNLGKGETAVLSYALERPSLRVVIDDMDARRCAKSFGIPMFGTGGVLLLAFSHNLVTARVPKR